MAVPFDSPNARIFYACQAVFIEERNSEAGNSGDPTATPASFLSGVQAVGVSTDNPATSIPNMGRVSRKHIQYGQQTIDLTIERFVNKGDELFYNVASGQYTNYASSHFLNANNFGSKGAKDDADLTLRNYDITILYGSDRFSRFGARLAAAETDSDNVISVSYLNCIITNISYSMTVDGLREIISLRTRNLKYNDDHSELYGFDGEYGIPSEWTQSPAVPETGEILKRQDFDLTESGYGNTKLPTEVQQLFNFDTPVLEGDLQILGIQSINIDVSIDYTDLTDVGVWRGGQNTKEYEQNRWVIVNTPISVTCSFTGIIRQSMPYFNFLTGGENRVRNVDNVYTKSLADGTSTDWQEVDREIKIVALGNQSPQDYYVWDLGKKNYLTSIEYTGGDAGGGNVEATINYTNQTSDFVPTRTTSILDLTYSEF